MATFARRERCTAFQWDGTKKTLARILDAAPNEVSRNRTAVTMCEDGGLSLSIGRTPWGTDAARTTARIGDYVFFADFNGEDLHAMPWSDMLPNSAPAYLWAMPKEKFERLFRRVDGGIA